MKFQENIATRNYTDYARITQTETCSTQMHNNNNNAISLKGESAVPMVTCNCNPFAFSRPMVFTLPCSIKRSYSRWRHNTLKAIAFITYVNWNDSAASRKERALFPTLPLNENDHSTYIIAVCYWKYSYFSVGPTPSPRSGWEMTNDTSYRWIRCR